MDTLSKTRRACKNDLKARYLLEKGRNFTNDASVHLESIEFELRKNNKKAAEFILNKSLQVFDNGRLWAYAVNFAEYKYKKTVVATGLEKCPDCPYLSFEIAKLFQNEKKYSKARGWYEKALAKAEWLGDVWIWYYKMEMFLGETENADKILERSLAADITKGKEWKACRSDETNSEIIKKSISN